MERRGTFNNNQNSGRCAWVRCVRCPSPEPEDCSPSPASGEESRQSLGDHRTDNTWGAQSRPDCTTGSSSWTGRRGWLWGYCGLLGGQTRDSDGRWQTGSFPAVFRDGIVALWGFTSVEGDKQLHLEFWVLQVVWVTVNCELVFLWEWGMEEGSRGQGGSIHWGTRLVGREGGEENKMFLVAL